MARSDGRGFGVAAGSPEAESMTPVPARKASPAPLIRTLVVDDNLDDVLSVQRDLSADRGFSVTHVRSLAEARRLVAEGVFDAFVLDYRLPDGECFGLLRDLREKRAGAVILVLTSVRQEAVARRARSVGADEFMVKAADYGGRLAETLTDLREVARPEA